MSEQSPPPLSVLQRKARAGRDVHRARAVSLARALRLAIGRVADKEMGLAMAVLALRRDVVDGEELGTHLANDDLILLLEGPGGQKGAAVLQPALAGALVQQQTMGQVRSDAGSESGPARRMTATDAALVAPFLNQVLNVAAPTIEVVEDQNILQDFRYGAQVPDLRLLQMALQAPSYHLISISADVAGGCLQGEIRLALPVRSAKEMIHASAAENPEEDPPARTLEPVVLGLEADLRIALTRVACTLSSLDQLKAGSVLDLGPTAFENVTVQSRSGKVLGKGALGQVDGVRAVQLHHRTARPDGPKRRKEDVPTQPLAAHSEVTEREVREPPSEEAGLPPPDLEDIPELADLDGFPDIPAPAETD